MSWWDIELEPEDREKAEEVSELHKLMHKIAEAVEFCIKEVPNVCCVAVIIPADKLALLRELGGENGSRALTAICRAVEKKLNMPEGNMKSKMAEMAFAFFW